MFTTISTRRTRTLIAGSVVALVVLTGAAPAFAKHGGSGGSHGQNGRHEKAARLKLRFKLVDHKLAVGDVVNGRISVTQQLRGDRAPVAGATVSVRLGGEEISSVTTGDDGKAEVNFEATDAGQHVVRAVLEDDGRGKVAQRSQGFRVSGDADEAEVEDADEAEVEDADEAEVETPETPESAV